MALRRHWAREGRCQVPDKVVVVISDARAFAAQREMSVGGMPRAAHEGRNYATVARA